MQTAFRVLLMIFPFMSVIFLRNTRQYKTQENTLIAQIKCTLDSGKEYSLAKSKAVFAE